MSDHERKTVTAIFVGGHPQLGEVFVNADRETHFVPRYRATKVNAGSVLLVGVDRNLDILVRINKGKNPKYRFKRFEA